MGAKNFRNLPKLIEPSEVIWLTPLQENFEPRKILVRSLVIMVTKKDNIQTIGLSHPSQKTSINPSNFYIID